MPTQQSHGKRQDEEWFCARGKNEDGREEREAPSKWNTHMKGGRRDTTDYTTNRLDSVVKWWSW